MTAKLVHVIGTIAVLLIACSRKSSSPSPPREPDQPQAPSPVAGAELWQLVDASKSPAEPTASVLMLRQRLGKLPADDIVRIDEDFRRQLARAYSWRVWGAAYLINGGCSDDCFVYFRAWLIMQGRTVFEATLRDPDSLAGYSRLTQPRSSRTLSTLRQTPTAK